MMTHITRTHFIFVFLVRAENDYDFDNGTYHVVYVIDIVQL